MPRKFAKQLRISRYAHPSQPSQNTPGAQHGGTRIALPARERRRARRASSKKNKASRAGRGNRRPDQQRSVGISAFSHICAQFAADACPLHCGAICLSRNWKQARSGLRKEGKTNRFLAALLGRPAGREVYYFAARLYNAGLRKMAGKALRRSARRPALGYCCSDRSPPRGPYCRRGGESLPIA
jgi:hypothetical protein